MLSQGVVILLDIVEEEVELVKEDTNLSIIIMDNNDTMKENVQILH